MCVKVGGGKGKGIPAHVDYFVFYFLHKSFGVKADVVGLQQAVNRL